MKIEVVKTMAGSPDGVTHKIYLAGETYEMPEALGAVFVREKWGKDQTDKKRGKGPDENK